MPLEDAFSIERLTKYRQWADHDEGTAMALYALNLGLAEAFYTSLHVLEITLRNAIHDRLSAQHHSRWFDDTQIITDRYQQLKVTETYRKLGQAAPEGQVVAELTFGFWTALFGKKNASLWGQDLRPIFNAGRPLQRKAIAARLSDIRTLRNRIAHHESIIQLDVATHHQEICEIIGWLNPDALAWCNQVCRFNQVYPGQQIIVGNLKNPTLTL